MIAWASDDEPAAADALQGTEGDELAHRLASPHRAEPTRKITMAAWNMRLRP